MKRCAASAAKVFGRGVGRTFLQKGFPTTSEGLASKKMPTGWIRLSTFKIYNISNFLSPVEVFWLSHLFNRCKSLAVGKPFWKKCFPTPLPKTFSPRAAHATVFYFHYLSGAFFSEQSLFRIAAIGLLGQIRFSAIKNREHGS